MFKIIDKKKSNLFNILILQGSSLGQEVFDMVVRHLSLLETAYFGLRYLDSQNQTVS